MKYVISLFLLLIMTSCYTVKPPKTYDFPKSEEVNFSFEDVWSKLIDFLSERNLPIKNLDKSSGFISTEKSWIKDENIIEYVDCGYFKNPDFEGYRVKWNTVIMNFNIVIKNIEENRTKVTVNVFFKLSDDKDKLAKGYSGCNGTGKLEKEIFGLFEKEIKIKEIE